MHPAASSGAQRPLGDWGECLGLGASTTKCVLGAVRQSACRPFATGGACVLLAEFPSPCLCPEVNFLETNF